MVRSDLAKQSLPSLAIGSVLQNETVYGIELCHFSRMFFPSLLFLSLLFPSCLLVIRGGSRTWESTIAIKAVNEFLVCLEPAECIW